MNNLQLIVFGLEAYGTVRKKNFHSPSYESVVLIFNLREMAGQTQTVSSSSSETWKPRDLSLLSLRAKIFEIDRRARLSGERAPSRYNKKHARTEKLLRSTVVTAYSTPSMV